MDFIEPILGVAQELYSLCCEVKANRSRCRRLASRVQALMGTVKTIQTQGPEGQPAVVHRGLRELKGTLDSAREVVKKYCFMNKVQRFIEGHGLGEDFNLLNERLNDAVNDLSLALHSDEKERLQKIFRVLTRAQEDREDCEQDRRDMETLLSQQLQIHEKVETVRETVDSTWGHVKEIKSMLNSMNERSPQLPDIREIKIEELKYNSEPFTKTNNSEVYKGEYNKFTVAIKRFTYQMSTTADEVRRVFEKEVGTMRRFESPNILRMYGICVLKENGPVPDFLIVMEYCKHGCLRQVLDGKQELSWQTRIQICLDAAQGLYRLHQSEKKFKVHGCINSNKFLVDSGFRVKLGGFELAMTETSLRKNKDKKNHTLCYCSPQQLDNINHQYDKACEVYSFGIVLWEVATRKIPFESLTPKQIHQQVCIEKFKEPLPQDCPPELAKVIDACRSFDPFQRPTAGALVDDLRKTVEEDCSPIS
ncbi:mixed lineage kinase domain-like protein [Acipenser ruthenus]|uniref:mixed lineage kinase domain-like protein n=1 Tax=Acipenser ruthenus TaxID=7906 RepID=UPI002741365E|nr:mixed lineage kinase domain-like protein [Acipenser ruthenus]XP_034784246.2 mixed lineage kinase domain-like protein [Acipenser ruthenus]